MPDFLEEVFLPLGWNGTVDHSPAAPEHPGVWWRYSSYVSLASAAVGGDRPFVSVEGYKVIRETEKSVWLDVWGVTKRVQRDWGRKYAYPTKDEAWRAWKERFRWRKIFHQQEARRIAALEALLAEQG